MREKNRLVCGWGINDADYTVKPMINGKQVWCPFYRAWVDMLTRCYSTKFQAKHLTYEGCSVCDEWLTFSNFKAWMETQDWEGKQLDKDLLVKWNKVYSPGTCVFLSASINSFIPEHESVRGTYPIGVCWSSQNKKYKAGIGDRMGSNITLGYFDTPEEAHKAWLTAKLEQAKILAAEQSDPRVAKALVDRYENYTED